MPAKSLLILKRNTLQLAAAGIKGIIQIGFGSINMGLRFHAGKGSSLQKHYILSGKG
jgi:hypothetical protein